MSSNALTRLSVEIAGSEISFETGRIAKQAGGAVVVRQGDTMVLATATAGNLRDADFLPLTVDVEERMYAAGKIPGSFFKREGRAGEKGTLTARMIDRPIRPLFPKGWRYETQIVAIPLSVDHVHPYDILAMNGASAALMISDIPLPTPVGAVRIGKVDGNFVVNPREEDLLGTSDLELIVAGTEDAILMVEAGAREIPEAEILDALDIAHTEIKKLCALQRELAAKVGKPEAPGRRPATRSGAARRGPRLARRGARRRHAGRGQARAPGRDQGRRDRGLRAVRRRPRERGLRASAAPPARWPSTSSRSRSSASGSRSTRSAPTGARRTRSATITIEVGVTPRTHGSALFTRGQTQALSVVALGTLKEEMRLDTLGLETKKYYWHHYNFPPFSVGEAGRLARAQAPRHRPRSARRARARADDPLDRGLPVQRSASSRTSSSPTARRRWRRSAAARCR